MLTGYTTPEIALALSRAKQVNATQLSIAKALGASQSQVSRILSGKTTKHSKLAEDICIYAAKLSKKTPSEAIAENADLMDALASVWDGTPGNARALATVIRSLGLLHSQATQA